MRNDDHARATRRGQNFHRAKSERAFEPAVEAGYRAATRALESLDCPLTELRVRRGRCDDDH